MNDTDTRTPTDPQQPVGTPPGGGRWTWDAATQAWVPLTDTPTEQE